MKEDIGYSGQYLDNKTFRLKLRTGSDIRNVTGDAVAGEMFLVTGEAPALYVARETSTVNSCGIYKVANLENPGTSVDVLNLY